MEYSFAYFSLQQCETQQEDHLCEVSIKHSGLHNEYNHKKSEIDDNSPCLYDFCVGLSKFKKDGLSNFSNLRFKPKTFTRSNNIYVVTHFVVPNAFRVTTSPKKSFRVLQDFPSWYQE